jgi:hypothetical protein
MDIAIIFDWFAQESVLAAELAIDQTQSYLENWVTRSIRRRGEPAF